MVNKNMSYLIILLLIISSSLFFSSINFLNALEINNTKYQRFDGIKEDFEDNFFPPAGWEIKTNTEEDGGLSGYNLEDPIFPSWIFTTNPTYMHSGLKAAYISYMSINYNWLITDLMGVNSEAKLKFWIYYGSELYPVNFFILLKGNVTNEWDKIASYEDAPINYFDYEEEIDLSYYAGQNVKIAFVQEYTDGWHIAIDDISFAKFQYDPLSISQEDNVNPYSIKLYQNYPNPFNPTTKINYKLEITNYELAEIVVYNAMGQIVWSSQLTAHNSQLAGHVLFDGSKFNSGVYYYSLIIDGKKMDTKSLILIK